MSNNDLDPHLIKCIGLLYDSRKLRKGDPVPLQYVLEEAIFQKYGVVKDFTDFFQSQLPTRESEEPTTTTTTLYDDKGNNSDNDLELDLFKDDLSCVICNKMDVGARNRLLECSDCHALYHQECHRPVVTDEDMLDTWTCSNCKSISSKKLKASDKDHGSKSSSSSKSESSHRHGGSSSSHKSSSGDKYKSSSSSKSSSGSKSSNVSPSHSSSRSEDKKSSSSKSSKSSSSKYYSEKRKHE